MIQDSGPEAGELFEDFQSISSCRFGKEIDTTQIKCYCNDLECLEIVLLEVQSVKVLLELLPG